MTKLVVVKDVYHQDRNKEICYLICSYKTSFIIVKIKNPCTPPYLLISIPLCLLITVLFTIAKMWKKSKCLRTNEWERNYIYTMEYYAVVS